MSPSALKHARSIALEFSDSERAELAQDLLVSLDGPPDTDAAAAWETEIERRIGEFDAGNASVIDGNEFIRRLDARLPQR